MDSGPCRPPPSPGGPLRWPRQTPPLGDLHPIVNDAWRRQLNFYDIGGSLQNGYFTQQVVNNHHPKWDQDEKDSYIVGWAAPSELGALEMHFSLVPIHQGRPDWNCQTWVVEAPRGLNQSRMYAVQMYYAQWFQQMGRWGRLCW